MKRFFTLNNLRNLALFFLFVGASGSLFLTLRAGRNNSSLILPLLFAGWVLSPFLVLGISYLLASTWSIISRVVLYILTIIISIISLIFYSGLLLVHATKHAFIFLAIPLIWWIVLLVSTIWLCRMSRKDPGT